MLHSTTDGKKAGNVPASMQTRLGGSVRVCEGLGPLSRVNTP